MWHPHSDTISDVDDIKFFLKKIVSTKAVSNMIFPTFFSELKFKEKKSGGNSTIDSKGLTVSTELDARSGTKVSLMTSGFPLYLYW